MDINFEAKTCPEAYLLQCTSEILTALIFYAGPLDDPRIGWQGRRPSTPNHFQCERCGEESLNSSQIQHKEGCSAAALLKVIEKVHKESGGYKPLYTAPQQSQPLSNMSRAGIAHKVYGNPIPPEAYRIIDEVEAAHGIKKGGTE